jgi:hypothetical protein
MVAETDGVFKMIPVAIECTTSSRSSLLYRHVASFATPPIYGAFYDQLYLLRLEEGAP